MALRKGSHLVVAAIDFGTTYSGWAFSFRHEFEKDPLKVSAKTWSGGQLVSQKGPTCVLIKPDGETLDSFGYDAESKYAELAEEGCHKQWYFFKRFKMMLFEQIDLKRDIIIEDACGKRFPAKKVFSLCIGYLKKDLINMSEKRIADGGLTDADILWVLTVPAIWNDAAKQFMREAAEAPEAGIPGEKLIIALEPEAASLYCRHIPVAKSVGGDKTLGSFKAETKYLVLDAGGGTVDITVHEVMPCGNLRELHKASGGAWGGTKVDDAFEGFLTKLFGGLVIAKFQENHMESYIDLFRSFEIKKREINPSKTGNITFTVPLSLMEIIRELTGKDIQEVVTQTSYAHGVIVMKDKLRVDADLIKALFDDPVKSVLDHVTNLLQHPQVRGCAAIVMVGGFSESPMLQDKMREQFPNIKIIIPEEAGLAVLKGAVIYGHCPTTIAERVCKYTYGTNTTHKKMDTCTHPPTETKTYDDIVRCQNIFDIHVKLGQTVKLEEEQQEQIYQPMIAQQLQIVFKIFASSSPNPQFVTENGCHQIGYVRVPLPDTTGGSKRDVGLSMKFGGTEIEVKAVDKTTGKITMRRVDFLG